MLYQVIYETAWPFAAGEVLLVDDSSRELFGAARKSTKWFWHEGSEPEMFDTVAEAEEALRKRGLEPSRPPEYRASDVPELNHLPVAEKAKRTTMLDMDDDGNIVSGRDPWASLAAILDPLGTGT